MFNDYNAAVTNIVTYEDMLEVLFFYYFDKNMLVWYKHLLDNKLSQKRQAQIGIFYNIPQSIVCQRLKTLQNKIKLLISDLDRHRQSILYLLNYIDKYATNHQKIIMMMVIQRKSYSNIARYLGISRQAVFDASQKFLKKTKLRLDSESLKFKKIFLKLYDIDLTKI